MLNLKENRYLFLKAEELVNIISLKLDIQLSLFLSENSTILIRILTEDFSIFVNNQLEEKFIYPAREIFKDSNWDFINIILKSIDADTDLLLEWSKACSYNDAVNILKLLYKANLYSHFPFSDRKKIIEDLVNHDNIFDEDLFGILANRTISKEIIGIAAQSNSIKVLNFLLENGTSPNSQDGRGVNPLMMAISGNADLSMIKLLVEQGANPNIVAVEYLILEAGALSLAIHLGKWDIAEYLHPLVSNQDELDWARSHLQLHSKKFPLIAKFKFYHHLNSVSIQDK